MNTINYTYLFCSFVIKRTWLWISLVFIFPFFISASYANSLPPLIVATETFNPPFIMQGAKGQLFGFDIDMMEDICRTIHRKCVYHSGFLENTIISNVEQNKANLGVASITITLDRMEHNISFSRPYLPSDAQFLGLNKWATVPYAQSVINGKKIGMQAGTIFDHLVKELGFSNIKIVKYDSTPLLIQALSEQSVDFILLDALAAKYWAAQVASFTTFGKPFNYGYGFAIVISKNEPELLKQINDALNMFEKNGQFKKIYDRYVTFLSNQ